jgi:RAB protein geranylgeranyltransferase component A
MESSAFTVFPRSGSADGVAHADLKVPQETVVTQAEAWLAVAIDAGVVDVRGQSVLQLQAASAAPGLVAAAAGARIVALATATEADAELLTRGVEANMAGVTEEAVARFAPKADSLPEDATAEQREALERRRKRSRPAVMVQRLLLGCTTDVRKALDPVGGSGFDALLVCGVEEAAAPHDALLRTVAQTLAKAPTSAAHIVPDASWSADATSTFCQLAVDYGLVCEPVTGSIVGDAQPYFVAKHALDDAGPPTDEPGVDVIVLGTGMVESAVSAAAARARLKVLHLDAQCHYGGGLAGGHIAQFETIVGALASDFSSATPRADVIRSKLAALPAAPVAEPNPTPSAVGEEAAAVTEAAAEERASLEAQVEAAVRATGSRQISVDVLPLVHLADGPLVRTLGASQIGPQLDFHNVCRVATIDSTVFPKPAVATVPLSRAAAFKSKAIGPMDVRRLMAFVKDLTASMPEPTHEEPDKPDPDEETPDEATERIASGMAGADYADKPLAELLAKKYKLSAGLVRLLTLDGELCDPAVTPGLSGIRLMHRYVTSVGKYGGATPYLASLYGAAELPQQLCRMSAVWDSTFVLNRSVRSIEYSAESCSGTMSDTPDVFARPAAGTAATLSNGQRVSAKVVVAPSGALPQVLAELSEPVCRAVILREGCSIPWSLLEKEEPAEDDSAEVNLRASFEEPIVVASCAFKVPRDGGAVVVRASIIQQTSATDQAPTGCTIVHAIAPASDVAPAELLEALVAGFGADEVAGLSPILYSASFTLDPRRVDAASVGGTIDVKPAQVWTRDGPVFVQPSQSGGITVVPVRTVFTRGLDDTRYVAEAQQAFVAVLKACGRPEGTSFLVKEDEPEEEPEEDVEEEPEEVGTGEGAMSEAETKNDAGVAADSAAEAA